jgi:single-stranded-DNA-specific exonuclease
MNFSLDALHPLTLRLLKKRGVSDQDAEDFLNPSYEKHIGDPFGIHGVPAAVDRILLAIKNNEKICVYSDYDCDGIPGGVLLRTFFDDIGYPVEIYVPHRHNEGYGVHIHAVDALKEKGVTLIITVDLAITNIEEIAYAKSVGVDFIVTDHHLPIHIEGSVEERGATKMSGASTRRTQVVPDAIAVINSKQDVCTYDDDMLCGCAVAWKLACAVLSRLRIENINDAVYEKVKTLPKGFEKWMLDLVGISTIADMVPLVKENRALAHYGLKVLRKTKRPGLLHIFNEQRMKLENLTEEDIAFTVAPRINAAGRMGAPIQAHHMLYERDRERAEQYARDLELLNTERKAGVKDIVSTFAFDHSAYKNDVVVVGDVSWGPGILGLIAQNIIDETGKPTFVWGQGGSHSATEGIVSEEKVAKGSCRSRGDVHVVELMARCREMFPGVMIASGGHEQAGGFSCDLERIDELSHALSEAYKHVTLRELSSQDIVADAELSMDDIHEVTYKAIAPLAPFGEGNPKPIFMFTNVTPLATKRFGKKNEHFEVIYPTSKGGRIKAIQFFVKGDTEEKAAKPHTLLAHLEKSFFAGKTELRLKIVDIR